MKIEDSRRIIWDLMERLRGVVYSRNPVFSALRLVFLKYAVDNSIGASNKEDMQQCIRAQKMFAMRDVSNGIETVIPVLRYIDSAYGLDAVLASPANIDEYARELFGADRLRQKRNASDEGFRSLMEYVGSLDLEEDQDSAIGRSLVDALISMLESNSERNSFAGENVTNNSVSLLAKALLRVAHDDSFLDFASGAGVSTLLITREALPAITNVELNGVNAAAAAMLYIMYGYQNIRILVCDSISDRIPDIAGNKLFVDPPLAGKVEKSETNEYSDMSLATLKRVIRDYLTRDGEAVVIVPSGTLFQGKKQAVDIRTELVQLGMVKAVISLPPMWYATSVNTNLLFISKKDMPRAEVLFVDATREMKNAKARSGAAAVISSELIGKIASVVADREEILGFSRLVHQNEIRSKDFNLVPSSYITLPSEEDTMTMEEVNARLAELYRQLMQ